MRTATTKFTAHRSDDVTSSRWIVKVTDGTTTYLFSNVDMHLTDGEVHGLLTDDITISDSINCQEKTWSISDVQVQLSNVPYRINSSGVSVPISSDLVSMIGKSATIYLATGADVVSLSDCLIMMVGIIDQNMEETTTSLTFHVIDGSSLMNDDLPITKINGATDANLMSFVPDNIDQRLPLIYGSWLDSPVKGFAVSRRPNPKFVFAGHPVKSLSGLMIKTPGGFLPAYTAASYSLDDHGMATAKPESFIATLILRPISAIDTVGYGKESYPGVYLPPLIDGDSLTYWDVQEFFDSGGTVKAEADFLFQDGVLEEFMGQSKELKGTCDLYSSNIIQRLTGDIFPDNLLPWTPIVIDGGTRQVSSVIDRGHLYIVGTGSNLSNVAWSIPAGQNIISAAIRADEISPFFWDANVTIEFRLYYNRDGGSPAVYAKQSPATIPSGDLATQARTRIVEGYDSGMQEAFPFMLGIYLQDTGGHGDGSVSGKTVFRLIDVKLYLDWSLNRLKQDNEEKEAYAYCEGMKAGAWLNGRNGYATDDLIVHPCYIVESILRDILGVTDIDTASFDDAFFVQEVINLSTWVVHSGNVYKHTYSMLPGDTICSHLTHSALVLQANLASVNFEMDYWTDGTTIYVYNSEMGNYNPDSYGGMDIYRPQTMRLQVTETIEAFDLIRTISEQSGFCFLFTTSGQARLIRTLKSPIGFTTARVITWDELAEPPVPRKLPVFADRVDITYNRSQASGENQTAITIGTGKVKYSGDWPYITTLGPMSDIITLWSKQHNEVSFKTKGNCCSDLEVGDWVEFDTASCDPHILPFGINWSTGQYLITSVPHKRLSSEFTAVKLF